MNDLIAVLISFAYVFVVLGAAEGLRKAFKLGVDFTRKVVHIGVGMWVWGTAALFQSKWFAIIPPLAFVLINYVSYRRGLFTAMESTDKSNLGTVYFPLAFILMIIVWFDTNRWLLIASLMPLTWGDSFAAVVGRRFGRNRYTVFGATRSWEGTITMLVLSFVSLFVTGVIAMSSAGLFAQPGGQVLLPYLSAAVLVTSVLSTIIESISPWGLDNLLVPIVPSVIALVLLASFAQWFASLPLQQ